jgi:hypothetical protein
VLSICSRKRAGRKDSLIAFSSPSNWSPILGQTHCTYCHLCWSLQYWGRHIVHIAISVGGIFALLHMQFGDISWQQKIVVLQALPMPPLHP